MSVKKFFIILRRGLFSVNAFAVTPRSAGKYKNWESFVAETDKGKICFAQTIPTKVNCRRQRHPSRQIVVVK